MSDQHKYYMDTTDSNESHNTQKEIAKDLGWSTGKVAMADKVWKESGPEVTKEKVQTSLENIDSDTLNYLMMA